MTVLGVGHDLNFSYCFLFHYLFVGPSPPSHMIPCKE